MICGDSTYLSSHEEAYMVRNSDIQSINPTTETTAKLFFFSSNAPITSTLQLYRARWFSSVVVSQEKTFKKLEFWW